MNISLVLRFQSFILLFIPVGILPSLLSSLYYKDGGFYPLLTAILSSLALSLILRVATPAREKLDQMRAREAYVSVALAWLFSSAIGAIPFSTMGVGSLNFLDAMFETISGFTTTGSTVITDIPLVPNSILLWRATTQWIGGMGIILLAIAILPMLGFGGMQLYKSEVPGPISDKISPKLRQTAAILWGIYVLFTVAEIVLLMIAGLSLFDAVTHTFTTLSSGGFSVYNESIAHYDSYLVQYIITFFMFLAGMNFSLHYLAWRRTFAIYTKNSEFLFYLLVIGTATLLIFFNIKHIIPDAAQRFKDSIFQVVSIGTTTGFCTADSDQWPELSKLILLSLMYIGGAGGSTAGGIKLIRVLVLLKYILLVLKKTVQPKRIIPLKIGNETIPEKVVVSIVGFVLIHFFIVIVSTFILAGLGCDLMTSFSAVSATINNIGPGFNIVGATGTYASIPMLGKVVLMACMLAGRLELMAFVLLFYPGTWKKY